MRVREDRIKRLFRKDDGLAVNIPIDHGIGGVRKGLERPVETLEKLIKCGIDGTLLQFGMVKLTDHLFKDVNSPSRMLTLDYRQYWNIPGRKDGIFGCFLSSSVEQAVKYDCDAVKVAMPYGLDYKLTEDHIKMICEVVREGDKCDMPVVVEPMPMGIDIPQELKNDPQVISNACRIAVELGADVLKAPYFEDKDLFREMVNSLKVPVMILGGSPRDIKGVLQTAQDAIEAGARGVVFGRNVWQHPKMEEVVKALIDIVHNKKNAEETVKKYNLN